MYYLILGVLALFILSGLLKGSEAFANPGPDQDRHRSVILNDIYIRKYNYIATTRNPVLQPDIPPLNRYHNYLVHPIVNRSLVL